MKFKIQHPSNILKGNNMFDGHILHNTNSFCRVYFTVKLIWFVIIVSMSSNIW